jgi:hypothetical protein
MKIQSMTIIRNGLAAGPFRTVWPVIMLNVLISLTSACGDGETSSPSALEDGSWDLSAPHCLSSDAPPAWPNVSARAALYDFDSLSERSLTLNGRDATEVWADDDCKLTVKRQVHTNVGDFFSLTQNKTLTWSPPGCVLNVTAARETANVTAGSSAAVADSTQTSEDIPWRITRGANGWVMISLGQEPVAGIWSDFGCLAPDSMVVRLKRR